ncbi:uncharacterized protein LOC129732753 [Wyeomyia smithii]|uniref:uncharacterized protein LOC129732753 n=1 Tax=Wyeomyia smithii TaxID=174621 RepID=UPI002467C9D3|nr:uncharacterized protein LOC129732753 [Wyeomyia smithii]
MLKWWTAAATASASAGLVAALVYRLRKRNRKVRTMRVNPYLAERSTKGRFVTAFDDMTSYSPVFKENFHMDITNFEYILKKIYFRLQPKRNTRPYDGIGPKEKLAIALEYLASGSFERHVASSYRVSKSSVRSITISVCEAIRYEMGTENLPCNDNVKWIDTANRFHEKWNFPNCLGAIDGKHVAIRCPPMQEGCFSTTR